MNTSTNAAAEMSPGILPCPGFPSATSDIGPKPRKPRGKIAELSKDQRALINHLLDEGLTYRAIELEMARQNISLNAENLSNWYNRAQKTAFTPEQFVADCRARARQDEIFEQAYMCNPIGAAANHI